MPEPIFEETHYGFRWRAVTVERCCSDEKKGWCVLSLRTPRTPHGGMQVYVTKTGKIRIYGDDNREWKPK